MSLAEASSTGDRYRVARSTWRGWWMKCWPYYQLTQTKMHIPNGKSRLALVREGLASGLARRGRLIVSLDRLLEDPKNERKTFRNMDGLVDSIRAVGLVEPITVTLEGDKFRIMTGHRRARAAKLANLCPRRKSSTP